MISIKRIIGDSEKALKSTA